MAYFSNGTEGEMYRERYCDRCKWDKDHKCPVWLAHLVHNYDDCNKDNSPLHLIIPRKKAPDFGNEECFFFVHDSMELPFPEPTV